MLPRTSILVLMLLGMAASRAMAQACSLPDSASWDALGMACMDETVSREPACTLHRMCTAMPMANRPWSQVCDLKRVYATLCRAQSEVVGECAS